jgi:putative oxidoreductase
MNPRLLYVLARVLIASVFVGLGTERLLSAAGVLSGRSVGSTGSIILSCFELLAGVMIMAGWQVGRIALLMAVFLAVDACLNHPFWRYEDLDQHGQLLNFLKNLSSIGGLLLLSWTETTLPKEPKP